MVGIPSRPRSAAWQPLIAAVVEPPPRCPYVLYMMSRVSIRVSVAVACLLLVPSAATSTEQEDGNKQGSGFVNGMKAIGHDIKSSEAGQGAKNFGKDVAEASREGFREVRDAFRPTAREVRAAIRAAWNEFLEVKRETLRELRKENERLKRELASQGEGS
jgi:hypothetical protein